MFEYKSKKEKKFKKVQKTNSLISATDLANFSYCPASYSIGKTFETDIIKSAVIGSKFHAENKLLKWSEPNFKSKRTEEQKVNDFSLENEDNEEFFSDIRNSRVIYSGHSDNEIKYFINKKGNFVGQPDYVFQNIKGENFIVEEKFKWKKEENIDNFFHSHKVQLASYIFGLDEFEASYGYLLYWYYSFDTFLQENIVVECKVLKISRSSQTQYFLRNTFVALSSFIKDKTQDFATDKLNPKKCANCVVNRFCGHKTGRFKDLEVPYNDKYLQLVTIPYPEELKKSSTETAESSVDVSDKNKPKSENLKDLLNSIDWDS
jgi:CRISPR/Cas system-associated exonuclease Cas4 (RecB family)